MRILEDAVFSVLREAAEEGNLLKPSEISRKTGIFRDPKKGKGSNFNDSIVLGLLIKLSNQNLAENLGKRKGWRLTEKGQSQATTELL